MDDVAPCVDSNAVVLEGELLDYELAQDPAPRVQLEGPAEDLCPSDYFVLHDEGCTGRPTIPCSVEGTHYTCRSIGYRQTQMHQVSYNGQVTPVTLEVEDCAVSAITLDLGG